MSSRLLRKLRGDTSLVTDVHNENSDPEESEVTGTRRKINVNCYDLFNQLSHSESEAKEDDDNDTETGVRNATVGADQVEGVGGDVAKRKKKKKKKIAKKTSSNQRSSEDNLEVDEVEQSVREVNRILGESPCAGPSMSNEDKKTSSRKGILNVEHRYLNPNNELKRIFGAKTIQNEQNKRRARGRGHIKSTWLVSARENWAPFGKQGISMKLVENENGVQYFTYEHSAAYQQVQMSFLKAVDTLNPDNIVAVINAHPYHVDSLLQLSDMCKMSEDLQMAAELNERVLFCLESAFHPSFNLAQGNCRLDYRKQENRALFIALFKHLIFVGQRACYRTALEFCKLLLSLDPDEDPMAVVLCVDFYALKAGEYAWLLQAAHEWESKKNLSQLPNFAFSIAVAQFYLGDLETADRSLQDALIMFPSVLVPLLDKCSVISDTRVTAHPFFTVLNQVSQRPALNQLVQLYVSRSYHVWKESDLLPWLERNTHKVLDRVEASDLFVIECHEKRLKRYVKPPRPVVRHIVLTDVKEVTATLTEGVEGSILSYDPLPPLDSINLYTQPTRERLIGDSNAFTLFFRSILPNFNVNERVPDPANAPPQQREREDDANEGAAGGAIGDFRQSVTTLVDAMRDLLANINIHAPDAALDAPADVDDSDDSEDEHAGRH